LKYVRLFLWLGLGALALVALMLLTRRGVSPSNTPLAGEPPGPSSQAVTPPPVSANPFQQALERIARGKSPRDNQDELARIKSALSQLPPTEQSKLLRDFLASRKDASTGQEFKVGADKFLAEHPTLRLFALDQLMRVDPAAAAAYAETVLASKESSEEWALALRNYALVNTNEAGRSFLQSKLREMLHFEPWQKNPSIGFLESFDVAVYLGGNSFVPDLSELVRQKENKAVAHASYLALDRLTVNNPAAVLDKLQAEPELMSGREVTRANFFARADVTDERQKAILEKYLLDPRRSPEELQTFAGLFPNGNFMISPSLLTQSVTPTREIQLRQDQQSLLTVERWLADPQFEKLKPQLEILRRRLQNFVKPSP
jgi:hypothetical protein